jgi:ribosomal protein S18 acetylase RimI-like enzyme
VHAEEGYGSAAGPADETPIVLREAEGRDFEFVLALWMELMKHHVELDDRFALAENARQRFFNYFETARVREDYLVRLALDDERPVGFIIACLLPNSPVYRTRWIGYINDLCVTGAMRRRGIGRILVDDAVRWLQAHGANSVEVYVAHHNQRARAFWERMGANPYLVRMSIEGPPSEPEKRSL